MTEQQRKAPGRPAAERYHAEYVGLPTAEGSVETVLQAAINERAKLGWKLVSMVKDSSGHGLFLVWDTSGFISPARSSARMHLLGGFVESRERCATRQTAKEEVEE